MIFLMVFKIYPHSKILSFSLSQAIYSRVARVCKSDQGGPHKFRDNWTSFLKTRLNCSVPGDHPFYFDEIQATSGLIDGHFIYGVFTTPDNSISGSAICGFSIKEISQRFVLCSFWGQTEVLFSDHDTHFLKIGSRIHLGSLRYYQLGNWSENRAICRTICHSVQSVKLD